MKFICTLALLCVFLFASAQRCATDEQINVKSIFRPDGTFPQNAKEGKDTLANQVIIIPVVIHVLYNNQTQNISDQQILSQITALNNDYRRRNEDQVKTPDAFKKVAADTRIEFCLAQVDPNGKATSGIIRKYTKISQSLADDAVKFSSKGGDDAWDATKYLNIWVCNLFGRTLGYAVLPGGPIERDGVVMKHNVFGTTGTVYSPYNKGRTATHEIGHWLGLQHLWGSENCGDDGINDTPKQQASNSGCSTFPHVSSCSENQFGDMFMNYMDFSDDACMNMFTIGQKNAMRKLFAKGGSRNSFLNSNVCDASVAEAAPLPEFSHPEKIENSSIKLYPNPFTDIIIITASADNDLAGKTLKIYNASGKQYNAQILQSGTTKVNLSHLPAGIYIAQIEGNDKPIMMKLIKVAR